MDRHDPDAFRALFEAHYGTVCRYLAARTDAAMIDDVAAEAFLVAWRRQPELPRDPLPWLLNTAAKCLANQRRSDRRAGALVERLAGVASPEAADALAASARRRALVEALASLPDSDRELLLLHHWDDLRPRELAVVLEINPVAARVRLHRARRRLQHVLRERLAREDVPAVEPAKAT